MRRKIDSDAVSRRFRLPDLSSLSALEFGTLVLALVAGAAWMGAGGLESHADLRQRHRWAEIRNAATSPVAYRKPVLATRRALLGDAGADAALLVLRADSLPDAAARERLCALVREGGALARPGVAVRWIALTGDVPGCARAVAAATPAADAATAIRAEIRSARWVVTDGTGRVLHNARPVPTAAEVREVLGLLRLDAPGRLVREEPRRDSPNPNRLEAHRR